MAIFHVGVTALSGLQKRSLWGVRNPAARCEMAGKNMKGKVCVSGTAWSGIFATCPYGELLRTVFSKVCAWLDIRDIVFEGERSTHGLDGTAQPPKRKEETNKAHKSKDLTRRNIQNAHCMGPKPRREALHIKHLGLRRCQHGHLNPTPSAKRHFLHTNANFHPQKRFDKKTRARRNRTLHSVNQTSKGPTFTKETDATARGFAYLHKAPKL